MRLGLGSVIAVVLACGCAAPAAAEVIDTTAAAAGIVDAFRVRQMADGNVMDPLVGAGPARRYSQAMFAYAGLRLAARTGDATQRAFALRSLDYVAARPESNVESPSVFEIGAAAAAYNALDEAPAEPARARIAGWLAGAPPCSCPTRAPTRATSRWWRRMRCWSCAAPARPCGPTPQSCASAASAC